MQRRILVVDDDPDMREMVGDLLGRSGHRVVTARDGAEAFETMLKEGGFDLVITDILMPNSDGIELVTRLKSHFPDMRVIAFSGGGEMLDSESCLDYAKRLGADTAIHKDALSDYLGERIDSLF